VSKAELPETLGWYRETAKWILSLSLGTLGGFVGLAGFSEKISAASFSLKLVFGLGCALVVIAVIAGVLFNLFIAEFGNALEELHKASEKADTDKSKKDRLDAKRRRTATGYVITYWFLLLSFLASLLFFATIGLWLLIADPGSEAKITWSFDGEKITGGLPPVTKSDSSKKVKELVEIVNLMNATYGKPKAQTQPSISPCPCPPTPPITVNLTPCCGSSSEPMPNCPQCRSKKARK
jgi:hypothetical protein